MNNRLYDDKRKGRKEGRGGDFEKGALNTYPKSWRGLINVVGEYSAAENVSWGETC